MTDAATPYAASAAALQDVGRRLSEVSAEASGLRATMTSMMQTVDGLRAGAVVLADLETRGAAARAKLDRTIADFEVTRARMTVAAADDRAALLRAAETDAEKLLADARATAAAEAEQHLAEVQRCQTTIAALDADIAARQGEFARITAAIAEARARIGA
jgi:chromosome segregation ATPase